MSLCYVDTYPSYPRWKPRLNTDTLSTAPARLELPSQTICKESLSRSQAGRKEMCPHPITSNHGFQQSASYAHDADQLHACFLSAIGPAL